jgi:HAMP domain-containing protein
VSPKNISLKVKLLGGFIIVSCLVFVICVISINATTKIVSLFEDVVHNNFQRYTALLAIKSDANEIINQTLTLVLQESESALDADSLNQQKNEIIARVEKVDQNINIYENSIQAAGDAPKLSNLSDMTDTVIDNAFVLLSLHEQRASTAAILASQKELIENQQILKAEIDTIVEKELSIIEEEDRKVDETVESTISDVYIVSLMTVLFAIATAFLISIPIVRKISKLRNAASEVAKGNFQVRLKDTSHDELGELATSFNQMTQKLQEVNEQNKKSTEELNNKSEELSQKMAETERINKLMMGRELKMIELKKEIEELKKQNSGKEKKT